MRSFLAEGFWLHPAATQWLAWGQGGEEEYETMFEEGVQDCPPLGAATITWDMVSWKLMDAHQV